MMSAALAAGPASAPAKHDWVVDNAHILSSSAIYDLTQQVQQHEKNTTDQFVILTVDSLSGWSVEDYARWIGNTWGIGRKDKNNGVLLLVAPKERRVRIEVGLGLENVLTNEICQSIIDNEILPRFKRGEMEQGVRAGTRAVIEALGGKYRPRTRGEDLMFYIMLPFFLLGRFLGLGRGAGGGDFIGGGGSFGGGGASGSW